ncbi:bifunctional tRNA (5-methylaminomethyl-2-thiouridine)(34)-methyltransferase MnmD/FAD-dependent 5-carboxymethylaminomethyl-2-thiouridine(34) oxidoreductase MnmC [Psychromonas sp. Urea-02u-13]|nr:bifunctional tRNA (5-methylaminomethyl-2-thiouridine)(34)-methyltransferase MnmD/FAD-dependent 5-carboxymethylaminomethyl-2-thiouridine(34) oxidoreductase MnmC [Psychromonas sp. Urea-02u-13]
MGTKCKHSTPTDLNQNSVAYNREYILSEDKNNQILPPQINWSDQSSSFSTLFDDLNFNTDQRIEASQHLFLDAHQLTARWSSWKTESFCIATTQFQSALNFLLIGYLFEQFSHKNPDSPLKHLFFSGFEKTPLSKEELQLAIEKWPMLSAYSTPLLAQYPLALCGCHRLHFNNITLDLWFDEVHESLASLYLYQTGLFDCWLIEARSLHKKTEQYQQHLFELISNSAKKGATLVAFNVNDLVEENLQALGFTLHKQHNTSAESKILVANLTDKTPLAAHGQYHRPAKTAKSKEIAIVGGGISSACLSLALIKRGYNVTLYCKDATLGNGASGNQQGALYPLLNKQHDVLSVLFANSFLYARNYVQCINQTHAFDFDFSGLLQLYYDQSASKKLDKIIEANLPRTLVEKLTPEQTDKLANIDIGQAALNYPLGGWLSPTQMVHAIFNKAMQTGKLSIQLNQHLIAFEENEKGWSCHFKDKTVNHELLVLTTAMHTLDFKQSEALPLSAARGQVTHIKSTPGLKALKLTLCHEGYLTPINNGFHCMGATFKRHNMDEQFSAQEQVDNKIKLNKCIPNKPWVEQIDEVHENANIGIRCTTRDHFPYMGALPDYQETKSFYQDADKKMPTDNAPFHRNLFILSGLGSRGLNTAPLLAETLASQINHEPLPLSKAILNAMQCNRQWVSYLKKGKTLAF